MLFSGWAWNVVCAPDVFSWNLAFMFLNLLQLFYIIYLMRPVKFDPELEDAYHTLFQPFKVSFFRKNNFISDNSQCLIPCFSLQKKKKRECNIVVFLTKSGKVPMQIRIQPEYQDCNTKLTSRIVEMIITTLRVNIFFKKTFFGSNMRETLRNECFLPKF